MLAYEQLNDSSFLLLVRTLCIPPNYLAAPSFDHCFSQNKDTSKWLLIAAMVILNLVDVMLWLKVYLFYFETLADHLAVTSTTYDFSYN